MKKQTSNLGKLILCIFLCELSGIVGSLFTTKAIPTWYAGLIKPALNPPSWVFGPVWTVLYAMMGVAAFLVWKQGWQRKEVKIALGVFGLQLVINALWSLLFFGLHNPLLALIDILLLWLLILVTMIVFYRISKPAAYLLLPYLCWVSFATYLNYAIYVLN
ncbi:tryptophan-rich sensory protein [Patescibacteria group bacterium]|nr:tryptophan-rich sensory protein [Patescibacteria group bacterium]